MKIYVCIKHVPDSAVQITLTAKNRIDESVTFLMNPYDEHAVEEAVSLKERVADCEVIAVTLGKEGALSTLQSALAMGADRGVFIKTDSPPDAVFTAKLLAAAISQDGRPDIIFTGKESIDSQGMQTAFRIGAALDIPVVSNAAALSLDWVSNRPSDQNRVLAQCEKDGGDRDVIEMRLPCVIGAGKSLNLPRYPTLPQIMKARKKEIKQIDPDSLGIEKPLSGMEILKLRVATYKRKNKILDGSPEQAVARLIKCLHEEEKIF